MFKVESPRKRVRRSFTARLEQNNDDSSAPLRGVVVCLTGLAADLKSQLHTLVEELGGKYARDLDTSHTTHLIALKAEGAKYQTALLCKHVRIVSPAWLQACAKEKKRVKEDEYRLNAAHHTNKTRLLPELIQEQLQTPKSMIFSSCQFFLIGFEENSALHAKLSRLIRWGMGTIYWELNESITHVIVHDECDNEIRDVARTLSLHHPNGPSSVSPWWVLSSWKEKSLQSPVDFVPQKRTLSPMKPKTMSKKKEKRKLSSILFRGSLFCLMRLTPPEGTVDFDLKEMEKLVKLHGGQILSPKWLEALKADAKRTNCVRRKCYMVTWGGYTESHSTIHPLLSQIKAHNLCTVIPVTPIWLQTSVKDEKELPVTRNPILFQPQSWPMRLLTNIKIAVTGFVGHERTSIIYLLRAIGAEYTESMRNSNTHLIAKEGRGPKYQKALEWGLHVVTVDWLYHVVQYGYGGVNGTEKVGCEEKFRVQGKENDVQAEEMGTPPTKRKRVLRS